MSKATCATRGCARPEQVRGWCDTCYQRLRRAGGFQLLLPLHRVHTLSDVDDQAATGICAICGPVKVKIRPGRNTCMTVVDDYQARRRAKIRADADLTAKENQTKRLTKYNLTAEQFDALLRAQGGRCAICLDEAERLVIDHDHSCCPGAGSCGKCVRGLLCDFCNHGVGRFRDNPELLMSAVAYLAQYGVT